MERACSLMYWNFPSKKLAWKKEAKAIGIIVMKKIFIASEYIPNGYFMNFLTFQKREKSDPVLPVQNPIVPKNRNIAAITITALPRENKA